MESITGHNCLRAILYHNLFVRDIWTKELLGRLSASVWWLCGSCLGPSTCLLYHHSLIGPHFLTLMIEVVRLFLIRQPNPYDRRVRQLRHRLNLLSTQIKEPLVTKHLMEPGQKLNIAVMKACIGYQSLAVYWLNVQYPKCTHYRQLDIFIITLWSVAKSIQLLPCSTTSIYKLRSFSIFFTILKQQISHIQDAVQIDHYICVPHRKHPSGFGAEIRMFINHGRASWPVSFLPNLQSVQNINSDKRLVNPGVNPSPHVHQVRI